MVLTTPDRHADFIGLAVTSVAQESYTIQVTKADLVEGALPIACWIRFDKVFTLSESSIVKYFGKVSPQMLESVLRGLCSVVGYTRR